jgi:hypothetical protein
MKKVSKTSVKKAGKKEAKKKLYCEVCGLVVTVDEKCNCVDVCDLICCGQPLKEKK